MQDVFNSETVNVLPYCLTQSLNRQESSVPLDSQLMQATCFNGVLTFNALRPISNLYEEESEQAGKLVN